jgi:hypothetical protein
MKRSTTTPFRFLPTPLLTLAAALFLANFAASQVPAFPHYRTSHLDFGPWRTYGDSTSVVSIVAAGDSDTGEAVGAVAATIVEHGTANGRLIIEADIVGAWYAYDRGQLGIATACGLARATTYRSRRDHRDAINIS